jgi:hypothetical protein
MRGHLLGMLEPASILQVNRHTRRTPCVTPDRGQKPRVARSFANGFLGSSRAEPSRLDASNWLHLDRDAWGIESGLHQRLDVSHNDDRCRVRNDNAMLVLGMMLCLSNSLFMQWRDPVDAQTMSSQPISNPPCPKTTTVRHSPSFEQISQPQTTLMNWRCRDVGPPAKSLEGLPSADKVNNTVSVSLAAHRMFDPP